MYICIYIYIQHKVNRNIANESCLSNHLFKIQLSHSPLFYKLKCLIIQDIFTLNCSELGCTAFKSELPNHHQTKLFTITTVHTHMTRWRKNIHTLILVICKEFQKSIKMLEWITRFNKISTSPTHFTKN